MENLRTYKTYTEMKRQHEEDIRSLNLGFAFNTDQFNEMMQKWGLNPETDTDKILSIGAGGFIQKKDIKSFEDTFKKIDEEKKLFKSNYDKLVKMLIYELANHEYCITHDLNETLDACGYAFKDVKKDATLKSALLKAIKYYSKNYKTI